MASRGVNKVILVGNLGADPEVRYMPSGGAVANLSVATSETWKDKNSGQKEERTEWHRVVLFNRLGEIAGQYLKKGAKVFIEGSLRTRKWQDKNGQERYTTEIVGQEMQMLDGRGNAEGVSSFEDSQESGWGAPAQQAQQGQFQANAYRAPEPAAAGGSMDFDDDIPF